MLRDDRSKMVPARLRTAAALALVAVVAIYAWWGGMRLDERASNIASEWKKTDALVLSSASRAVKYQNRTRYVYDTRFAFRPIGSEELVEAELVFQHPKSVGQSIEVFYDPTKSRLSPGDIESAEHVSIVFSDSRRMVSAIFLGSGILLAILSIAIAASNWFRLTPLNVPEWNRDDSIAATPGRRVAINTPELDVPTDLRSADPEMRINALDAVRSSSRELSERLASLMTTDPSRSVRAAASRAAVRIAGGESTLMTMLESIRASDPVARKVAIIGLSSLGSVARERVLPLLNDSDPGVRKAALEVVQRFEAWPAPSEP